MHLRYFYNSDQEQCTRSNSILTGEEVQGSDNAGYVPEDNVFLENSVEQTNYVDPHTKL